MIGRLRGVTVDIDGVHSMADFEVIDIVENRKPYRTLLGIEWDFTNQATIDLKKWKMIFEGEGLRVIAPLDMMEGRRYVEQVRKEEMEIFYNVTMWMDDYFKPMNYGMISWHSINSHTPNFEEALEYW